MYRVLVSSANLRELRSLGLNRLSGEGVDLVADWGLIPDDELELCVELNWVVECRVGFVESSVEYSVVEVEDGRWRLR